MWGTQQRLSERDLRVDGGAFRAMADGEQSQHKPQYQVQSDSTKLVVTAEG